VTDLGQVEQFKTGLMGADWAVWAAATTVPAFIPPAAASRTTATRIFLELPNPILFATSVTALAEDSTFPEMRW
jgi:hypothetical protein